MALAAFAATVTGVAVAIADTGTLVLDGSPLSGRRALSLLPDCLVCVVEAAQVVGSVPEGLAVLDPTRPADDGQRPVGDQRHRAVPGRGRARSPDVGGRPGRLTAGGRTCPRSGLPSTRPTVTMPVRHKRHLVVRMGVPMVVDQPGGHARHRRQPRRRRSVLVATVVGLFAAAVVLVALLWNTRDPTEGRAAASGSSAGTTAATATAAGSRENLPATPAASLATPTAGAAVPVGRAPHFVQVSPDGRFAYIADPVAGAVFRFDTARQTVTATIPIPQAPPQMLTFAPDGKRAYVAGYTADYSVDFIDFVDTSTDSVVSTVPVGRGPYAVGTSPDGRLLYVPLYDDDHLDVIDTDAGAVVTRIPAAPCPHWVAFSPDGKLGTSRTTSPTSSRSST